MKLGWIYEQTLKSFTLTNWTYELIPILLYKVILILLMTTRILTMMMVQTTMT